jgi:hypothetical protein
MSDVSQGPGWWIAADGKWYPPERHPDYRPQGPPAQSAPPPQIPQGPPVNLPPPVVGPQPPFQPPFAPGASEALEAKDFFRSLYDFSFSSFITLRVIRILYVLITIVYSLAALVAFVVAIARHTAVEIVFAIVVVPIAYIVYMIVARITLEVLMLVFNIGKDVRAIREQGALATR